ncbi:MAG: TIGR01777 family oxidoreductase [Myxococcota bacterium]|nr:TIGR01777 family oxidoreductase [Myxococcota bacterium]
MSFIRFEADFPGTPAELFEWHSRPHALTRLLPPWNKTRVIDSDEPLQVGARVLLKVCQGPLKFQWESRIQDWEPGKFFSDTMVRGPFKEWNHLHHFSTKDDSSTTLTDEINYRTPLGATGDFLASVIPNLKRMFRYRHTQLRLDLERHRAYAHRPPLRIAISGASGMIGVALRAFLSTGGHEVFSLVRRPAQSPREIEWDPAGEVMDAQLLEGMDAVIHLAGANIAEGRWSKERKGTLTESRVRSTRFLATTLAGLERPPALLLSMSGAGHYGYEDHKTVFTEASPPGSDFLAQLTVQWEGALQPAREAGIRTVVLRTPAVLSARGGALQKMLLPFQLGGGGPIGSGTQPMGWVALDDLLGLILVALHAPSMEGPFNVQAPEEVNSAEFAKTLGKVLSRPAAIPLPAFVVKRLFGEMGEALLLGGQRLNSARLSETDFEFQWPTLEGALRHELGRPPLDVSETSNPGG